MKYTQRVMKRQKRIALIAHDNMKDNLISWCRENADKLRKHTLCGTGTTATLLNRLTDLSVKAYNSGPLGGDQQIGSRITEGGIDILIFFSDPLSAQPHDPDIRALLRISQVYDIPIATNRATADFLITSEYFETEYENHSINNAHSLEERIEELEEDMSESE
ncbi:MAG: methylglyoxal synthase [Anaerofustis stercorihominis]|nr:methylglyoxal synthase [Anaerofustis stercorihominis]